MVEFLQRLSLLTKLQNCWTKGHSDIKLHCSLDDDFHDVLCQLSPEEFTCDANESTGNALQAVSGAKTGNSCDFEGERSKSFIKDKYRMHHCGCSFSRNRPVAGTSTPAMRGSLLYQVRAIKPCHGVMVKPLPAPLTSSQISVAEFY